MKRFIVNPIGPEQYDVVDTAKREPSSPKHYLIVASFVERCIAVRRADHMNADAKRANAAAEALQ